LDWRAPATVLARRVRAFDPFPGAATLIRETPLKLWRAHAEAAGPGATAPGTVVAADASGVRIACGEGVLCVTELQRAGGRRLQASEFLAGFALAPGERCAAPAP
jgi:methionyl-tRNA formyltransferase